MNVDSPNLLQIKVLEAELATIQSDLEILEARRKEIRSEIKRLLEVEAKRRRRGLREVR